MLKCRRESVLDIYNLGLALFLFVTPWLFAYANEYAKIDLWAASALIAVISFTTFIAFSNWEEWLNLLLGIWLVISPWILGFAHTRVSGSAPWWRSWQPWRFGWYTTRQARDIRHRPEHEERGDSDAPHKVGS